MKKNYFFQKFFFGFLFLSLSMGKLMGQTCTWTVDLRGSYGDQISWELRDANSAVLLSGGNYPYGYSDNQTVEAEGPVEFYIETLGTWTDNLAVYNISNGNGIVATGTITGGLEKTVSGLQCSDTVLPETSGCLSAFYGALSTEAFVPSCAGIAEIISAAAYAGNYALVQVTAGTEYKFASSIATDVITISNEAGEATLAKGTSSLTWTATESGVIRYYLHADGYCNFINTFRNMTVQCGETPPPPANPDYACFQGDGLASNNFENAFSITEDDLWRNADDFIVSESTEFDLKYIRLNTAVFKSTVSSMYFKILADDNGVPSNTVVATTDYLTPSTQIIRGFNEIGFTITELGYVLPETIHLPEGRYWLLPQATAANDSGVYWEMTSTGNTGNYVHTSVDNGEWTADSRNYNAVFFVGGDCNTLATSEVLTNTVSYYPNPVENELYVNSKNPIKNIQIYNIAGQKVVNDISSVKDGKIDTTSLKTGVYIFNIIYENGKQTSLKINKK
ncbi:T9SS type A sorting domain-containing protein [Epilithonimonas sp.]|uniref:T9SS type A sorting domain-containing protein n=1 Tax=Epilithonimonas sp. TaxID=2894511 RepID=UPI0028A7F5F7|nr:T9SS type A sorting domain-containing protein [Epilithonimonas sp.]